MRIKRRIRAGALAIPALLLLLPGCGGNRVIINLDMDSFMAIEDRQFDYIGINPGGTFTETSPIEPVSTPEGLKELVDLEEMTVDLVVELDNTEAVGEVTLAVRVDVFLAASETNFYVPANLLVSLEGLLDGGSVSELGDVFDVEDFLTLFQDHDTLYMGLRVQVEHASGLGVINGHAEITRLHLHVEARENLF